MERVKRLAGNEIELGMKIPTIESRASNIPMTKGITYVVITVRLIKIFVEYWLLHILRRTLLVKPHNSIRCSLCHRYVTCPRFDRRYLNT